MPKIKWVEIIHFTQGFTIGAFYSGNSPSTYKMVFAFKTVILTIFQKPIYRTKLGTPIKQMDLGLSQPYSLSGPRVSPHLLIQCPLPAAS